MLDALRTGKTVAVVHDTLLYHGRMNANIIKVGIIGKSIGTE